MAPHHNPDATSTQDTLQRTSERLVQTMARHPMMVRGLAVGLALVVATAWGSMAISRSKAQKAGFALAHAFAIKDAVPESLRAERNEQRALAKAAAKTSRAAQDDGDDDDGDDARDDDGDDGDDSFSEGAATGNVPAFATAPERDEAARKAFAKLAQGQSGPLNTLAALEAVALAEELALADKAPAEAAQRAQRNNDHLQLLTQASAAVPGQNSLAAVAALRRAQLAEDNQDAAAALAAYNQVIASQIQFLGDEARLHKARLLMAQGHVDEAADVLEDVQNNYPQTSLADELRIQMAALEEHRAATDAKAPSHEPARASAG